MLISKKRRFLFIHIYKNAGTSITKALIPFAANPFDRAVNRILREFRIPYPRGPQPFHAHITATELAATLGREVFNSYFTFAFVRNPWDWQVSLYKYMLKDAGHHQHQFVKSLRTFDEYLHWRCANEVRFQRDFVYSSNGEVLIDFVGRYERLNADFEQICSRLGISAFLPKLNVSSTKPYQDYYTNNTKELVQRAFEPDIQTFKYEFE